MEIYATARQAIDDSITRRMRVACWTTKAKETHSEYVIFIASPRQQWLCERPQCQVMLTLHVLFHFLSFLLGSSTLCSHKSACI